MVTEFGLDLSGLVLDMADFAAYIDSTNDRAPIASAARRNRNGSIRELVGLALVVTRDGGVQVVSHAYPRRSTRRITNSGRSSTSLSPGIERAERVAGIADRGL